MRKKLIWWVFTVIWCIFIFFMSGKPGYESSRDSNAVLMLLRYLAGLFVNQDLINIHPLFIRKMAHYVEYFILGFLLFMCFLDMKRLGRTFFMSAAAGAIYSITDELHQFFVPGRVMSFFDAIIDFMGVLSALSIMCICFKRKKKV